MNWPSIEDHVVSSLLVRLVLLLIRTIATREGADDLTFMLVHRLKRGAGSVLRSIPSSLWAALGDRVLWIRKTIASGAFLRHKDGLVLSAEGAWFFFGLTLLLAYPMERAMLWLVAERHSSRHTFDLVRLCLPVAYSIVMGAALRWTRVIMEHPATSVLMPRTILSLGIGIAGGVSIIGLLELRGVVVSCVVVILAVLSGALVVRTEAVVEHFRRRRALARWPSQWGPRCVLVDLPRDPQVRAHVELADRS